MMLWTFSAYEKYVIQVLPTCPAISRRAAYTAPIPFARRNTTAFSLTQAGIVLYLAPQREQRGGLASDQSHG